MLAMVGVRGGHMGDGGRGCEGRRAMGVGHRSRGAGVHRQEIYFVWPTGVCALGEGLRVAVRGGGAELGEPAEEVCGARLGAISGSALDLPMVHGLSGKYLRTLRLW